MLHSKIFDFNKYIEQFNLIISITCQVAGRTEFAAECLKIAIKDNQPNHVIIATVKDMIADNEPAMVAMLGDRLTGKIKSYVI